MENSLWQMGAEFQQGQSNVSQDHQWSAVSSKLAEITRSKTDRIKSSNYSRNFVEANPSENFESMSLSLLNIVDLEMNEVAENSSFRHYSVDNCINGNKNKKYIFKCLPSTEKLPRNEILGGYIFICNNETMKEDLKSQLFCLPPRFRDSVRAITPGLPIFLYNYTTRRLHGIFEAASFGGSNIDPTAWEDVNCKGESMFPAQVRIRARKLCKPLEEGAFRPVLYHYHFPRFRFELSIPETFALLDLYQK